MNRFAFDCPIKGGRAEIADCSKIHSQVMQGKASECADGKCAVAALSWMCPFRVGARVGGPWGKPGSTPHSDLEMETPAKLPRPHLAYALQHRLPSDADYRRAGLKPRIFNDELEALQRPYLGESTSMPKTSKPTGGRTVKRSQVKPESRDELIEDKGNEMAAAVSELAKQEQAQASQKARQTPPSKSAGAKSQTNTKATERASEKPQAPAKRMTMAERAKMMRERRQNA